MIKFAAVALISVFSMLPIASAQPQREMENDPAGKIVLRSIPPLLVDKVTKQPVNLATSFSVFDRWPGGAPKTIVAAYSNAQGTAALVVEAAQDGTSAVAYQTTDLVGGITGVKLHDVDGDGVNEILISFGAESTGGRSYIFRWNGSSLVDIGPEAKLPQDLSFMDLYHDGTLALVAADLHPAVAPPQTEPHERGSFAPGPQMEGYSIYHFAKGSYAFDRNVLLAREFKRRTSARLVRSHIYEALPGSHGPYLLRIVNGATRAKHRVASRRV